MNEVLNEAHAWLKNPDPYEPDRLIGRLAAALEESEAAHEKLSEVMVNGVHFEQGSMNIGLEGGMARYIAAAWIAMFKDSGGVNYIQFAMDVNDPVTRERYVVTVQKKGGLTPTEKLAAAEADMARVRALRDNMQKNPTVYTVFEVVPALNEILGDGENW